MFRSQLFNIALTTTPGGNSLKKSCDKKSVCEMVWFLWFCPRNVWGQKLFVFQEKPIYKRNQIVITELEIGAVDTDFSRRTSLWARENAEGPEHGNQ
jgi:hypothetical protein